MEYVLRHWRGNGQIIPSIKKKFYHDYPKHRNKRPYRLEECFVKDITEEEYNKLLNK